MITVLINRMLITSGIVEVHPGPDPAGRETPFKMPRAIFNDYDNLNYDDNYDDDDAYYGNMPRGTWGTPARAGGAGAGGRYPMTVIELDIKPQKYLEA
jgi:hypothetical protein